MAEFQLIVTCEHGGNKIPGPYRSLFNLHLPLLDSHRGYDWGALETARMMARRFQAPLFTAGTSRLLVDLNRSIGHPALFSNMTRHLPAAQKETLLARHYYSHRNPIENRVKTEIHGGATVVHIACHSFTPVLNGKVRPMDIGLLYDPRRQEERQLCSRWKSLIVDENRNVKVSRNAPYKGVSDGLATYFRKQFPTQYLGIELELNQGVYLKGKDHWRRLNHLVIDALAAALL